MRFPARIERFRSIVERTVKVVAPNVVLSIIQQESNGVIGRTANRHAAAGGYARGLMQVIRLVTSDYNRVHHTDYDHVVDMGGKGMINAEKQIRVGAWVFERQLQNVRRYMLKWAPNPRTADVVRIADCAYAVGWGNVRRKLDILKSEGLALTFDSLAARFPYWGSVVENGKRRWINRPLHHAQEVWGRAHAASYGFDGDYRDKPGPNTTTIVLLAGIAISIVVYWLSR